MYIYMYVYIYIYTYVYTHTYGTLVLETRHPPGILVSVFCVAYKRLVFKYIYVYIWNCSFIQKYIK